MTEKGVMPGRDARAAAEKPVRPETGAEKAERRRFEEAREEYRIVDGVRTKIDRRD